MSDSDKEEYLKPYLDEGEGRRPTLTWPRNIPLDGTEPSETLDEVILNAEFHSSSEIPKLFIDANPGLILTGEQRDEIRKWSSIKEVEVKGNHFIQEDSPNEITAHIKSFLAELY